MKIHFIHPQVFLWHIKSLCVNYEGHLFWLDGLIIVCPLFGWTHLKKLSQPGGWKWWDEVLIQSTWPIKESMCLLSYPPPCFGLTIFTLFTENPTYVVSLHIWNTNTHTHMHTFNVFSLFFFTMFFLFLIKHILKPFH